MTRYGAQLRPHLTALGLPMEAHLKCLDAHSALAVAKVGTSHAPAGRLVEGP